MGDLEWTTIGKFQTGVKIETGGPLSPCLFILCMEVFAHKTNTTVMNKRCRPSKVARLGPKVSHLIFAKDLLPFGEVLTRQARVMEDLLEQFCEELGQRVNLEKSRVWFSPTTPPCLAHAIVTNFGIPATRDPGLCLGMPLFHKRWNNQHFQHIVDKVNRRFGGWKGEVSVPCDQLDTHSIGDTCSSNVCHEHLQTSR